MSFCEPPTDPFFSLDHWEALQSRLDEYCDVAGYLRCRDAWHELCTELESTAAEQRLRYGFGKAESSQDSFATYARLYDAVIGRPCLEGFMSRYIDFVWQRRKVDASRARVLSIGCGTGVVEADWIARYALSPGQMVGIDRSPGMVSVAGERIEAHVLDLLSAAAGSFPTAPITFAGLNVFQYIPFADFRRSIQIAAYLTEVGGFFFGDFVTPDHMRWYPDLMRSLDVVSLRRPCFVEREGRIHQESAIINVSRLEGFFHVTNEGRHLRHMPPMSRLRAEFARAFGGPVAVFDALSLEPCDEECETTPSTRYLLIAERG